MTKYKHLSQDQRYQIEALKKAGQSQSQIAEILGVNKSSICRELKRNSVHGAKPPDRYKAQQAQIFADKRTYKMYAFKSSDKAIEKRIKWLLRAGWSPEQIACCCAERGIEMLSTEGIYQWIYQQKRFPVDYTSYLRRHHRKRRKRRLVNQPRTIIKDKVSIHDRPQEVEEQLRFGDMETDLVKCQNGYLITITERKSLFNFIIKIPNKEALTIQNAIIEVLGPVKAFLHTITSDNGTEFANHQAISKALQIPWFFADPYCSQQRGCNENQNGLIRQYFKRDTDLNSYSQLQINGFQKKLNYRPRKKNKFLSPCKLLSSHRVALAA
jgi:IS30 family transposase